MAANLDLVRSIYEAWGRGDFSAANWASPEIEYVSVEGPDPGVWNGLPALLESSREFLSAFSEFRVEAESFRELDEDRILVLTNRGGRGKRSGLDVWEPAAQLVQVRDGKVVRLVAYWERARALRDLGLDDA